MSNPSTTAEQTERVMNAASSSNDPKAEKDRLEQLCVNTIRFLAIDAVEKANSGHPGTPMGMADIAFVLWTDFLKHDPKAPDWVNRDRFILSAGHASMLLYSLLHLSGYPEMTLDQLREFRQWGSKTAGHPEYGFADGIETTTGPLGQGVANGVGMGLASKMMAARFNDGESEPIDHYVYALVSDGDLMEGVANEAISIAGHLGLGNLIYFYDDNLITIEGETRLAYSEEVDKHFKACNWHVVKIDGHDRTAIRKAIRRAQKVTDKPSLIVCRTIIGWGAPNLHGTSDAHGAPLGAEEVAATKKALGWPASPDFYVPDQARDYFLKKTKKLARARRKWEKLYEEWAERSPEKARLWDSFWSQTLPEGWKAELIDAVRTDKDVATRKLSGAAIQKLAELAPWLTGGSADLGPSNNTEMKGEGSIARAELGAPAPELAVFAGRNLHFGVREHAMGAIVNGMTLYGSWRVYGGTFLIFSDYMRPPIRLAALMKIPSIFVFTHDSVFLGEDGPTHQPIEQLWALRAIPGLTVFRPADDVETAMTWAWAVSGQHGPAAMAYSRQSLKRVIRPDDFDPETVLRGAYVLEESDGEDPITIIATGSEVSLAVAAAERLRKRGVGVRIASAPCLELFDQQPEQYREEVLGSRDRRVTLEAGATLGWASYTGFSGLNIGIDTFGHSAPYEVLAEKLGFTAEAVEARILDWLEK